MQVIRSFYSDLLSGYKMSFLLSAKEANMFEYRLLESLEPASAEQLECFSFDEGWKLQLILQFNDKFYYHLVRDKYDPIRFQCEYRIIRVNELVLTSELESLAEKGWLLKSVIWWEEGVYYYFLREKIIVQ